MLLIIVALTSAIIHQSTVVQIKEINEIMSLREYSGASFAVTSKKGFNKSLASPGNLELE